jgi:hypothetical protein
MQVEITRIVQELRTAVLNQQCDACCDGRNCTAADCDGDRSATIANIIDWLTAQRIA